jgi:hypothetical protein
VNKQGYRRGGLYRVGIAFIISLALIFGSVPVVSMYAPQSVSDNISVYAASKSAKVKVKLNLKGGSLSYYEKSTKYVKKGTKIGILPKPYHNNYTFIGWYTAKSSGAKILSKK